MLGEPHLLLAQPKPTSESGEAGVPGVLGAQIWAPGWELGGPLSTTPGAHTHGQALPAMGHQAPGRQGRR